MAGEVVFGGVVAVSEPWPCWTVEQVFSEDALANIRAAVAGEREWVRHDTFYQCHMAQLTEALDPDLLASLREAVGALTGWRLTEQVNMTAQRMGVGDQALPHSDRPLLGFETGRLVIQLTPDWDAEQGGWFCVHPDAAGEITTWRRAATANRAVLFAADPGAHHSVLPAKRERLTAVLNLWHVGNCGSTEALVRGLLADADFSELPPSLDALVGAAEAEHDPDITYAAGLVALVLTRWDCANEEIAEGYEVALSRLLPNAADADPVRLALWVVHLYERGFVLAAWRLLQRVPLGDRRASLVAADAVLFARS